MSKHTPGPWYVSNADRPDPSMGPIRFNITNQPLKWSPNAPAYDDGTMGVYEPVGATWDDTEYVASTTCGTAGSSAEANAHLIAAAPDYYAAAEAIRAHVVAAERLDDGRECEIPADLIRALLDAHKKAYAPPRD